MALISFFKNKILNFILTRVETELLPVKLDRYTYRIKMVKKVGGKEVSSEIISGNLSRTEIVKVFMKYPIKLNTNGIRTRI